MTKRETAEHLGVSEKTLERRAKTEPLLQRVLRKGRQVFWPVEAVEEYRRHSVDRGYI